MNPQLRQFDVAPMPPLDDERLTRHAEALAALAIDLGDASPSTHRAFIYVQRRILLDAAASIPPVESPERTPLLPIRRRFVPTGLAARRVGVGYALRHVDERLTMIRTELTDVVVAPETPTALHALVEGADPNRKHTNAGMIRVTQNRFADGDIPFGTPPPEHCRRLVADAVAVAADAPAPMLTRSLWLLATIFAIHPFVDGNGRTGRLLMHLLLSSDSPTHVDWATISEFSSDRRNYLEATRKPLRPSLPEYDARLMEPIHLMRWCADASTRGHQRVRRRLHHISDVVEQLTERFGPVGGLVVFGVHADRNARLDELASLIPEPDLTRAVNELVAAGVLTWDRYGYLQLADQT